MSISLPRGLPLGIRRRRLAVSLAALGNRPKLLDECPTGIQPPLAVVTRPSGVEYQPGNRKPVMVTARVRRPVSAIVVCHQCEACLRPSDYQVVGHPQVLGLCQVVPAFVERVIVRHKMRQQEQVADVFGHSVVSTVSA